VTYEGHPAQQHQWPTEEPEEEEPHRPARQPVRQPSPEVDERYSAAPPVPSPPSKS
jgi:hypothetical protein